MKKELRAWIEEQIRNQNALLAVCHAPKTLEEYYSEPRFGKSICVYWENGYSCDLFLEDNKSLVDAIFNAIAMALEEGHFNMLPYAIDF